MEELDSLTEILLDAFTQSAWEAPPAHRGSILLRMRWAYARAITAIFVTTLTDCMAFLASAGATGAANGTIEVQMYSDAQCPCSAQFQSDIKVPPIVI